MTLLVNLVVLALDCRELVRHVLLGESKKEAGYCVCAVCSLKVVYQEIPADNRLGLGVELGDDCHFLLVSEWSVCLALGQPHGLVMLPAER